MRLVRIFALILSWGLSSNAGAQDLYQKYSAKIDQLPTEQAVDSVTSIISSLRNTQPWIGIKLGHNYLSLAKSINDLNSIAKILDEIGVSYRKVGQLSTAYSNHADAFDIYETLNDSLGMSFSLSNIGSVYFSYGDYEKAIENFEKSLKIKEKLKNQKQISYTLSYLGRAYKECGDVNKARELFFRGMQIDKKFNDELQLAKTLTFLGELELVENNHYLCEKYLNDAREIFRKYNNYFQLANVSAVLINYYMQTGNERDLILTASEGLNSSQRVEATNKEMEIEKLLYQFYESKGDEENAFIHLKKHNELLTQIYFNERTQEINEITDLYALRRERQALEHEFELEQVKIQFKNYIIYLLVAVIVFAILLLFITIQKYIQRKNLNNLLSQKGDQLKEVNLKLRDMISVRDTILSIIAHDLKNPFNHLINATTLLYEDYEKMNDDDKKTLIKSMGQVSDKANQILQDLLDWAVNQSGNQHFHPEKFDIKDLIAEVISLQTILSSHKNIKIVNDTDKSNFVLADKNSVDTILRNLLSNAVKFSNRGGNIEISVEQKDNEVVVNVKDEGIGIPKSMVENIFKAGNNKSRQGTSKEQGSGLGLVLCKELVEKNNGKIWVSSTENKGSVFSFSLPLAE